MRTFDFTITIDRLVEVLDEIDWFYGDSDDASTFNSAGETHVTFHREAASLDDAIRSALTGLLGFGYGAKRIEVEPDCVAVP